MTDYNRTGNPVQGSRGLSVLIRNEFTLIETALDSKANIDSPALTGTPTGPTPTIGDNSTKLATTAFVFNAALTSTLPGQTGNAGKFLQTDGTNASWQFTLPTQTGNSGEFLATSGTSAAWGLPNLPPDTLLRLS